MKKGIVLALALTFGFAACSGGTPEDACQNMVDQCDATASGESVSDCADSLQKQLDDGTIKQEDIDCFADASDCEGIANCTAKLVTSALSDALNSVTDTSN